MIVALALVPLTLAIGAAIDFSYALDTKTKLASAADAAALAAVNRRAITSDTAAAKADAVKVFNAQLASGKNVTLGNISVEVTESNGVRAATVRYTATVSNTLMAMFGDKAVEVGGTATASSAIPGYIDFYLLLDNTPSMGVGATPADVATMVRNTSDKCAFACHDLSNSSNYYKLAKKLGVTMRIDVVRTATQRLMDTATQTALVPGQFRAAIYTFGAAATGAGLTNVAELTSNLSSAKSSADVIDLMTVPYQNYRNDALTDYDGVMTAMNTAISVPGDGTSASKPQKVLFFVSDGVADQYNPRSCSQPLASGGRCQEPIDQSLCKAIKERGIKIAVLYTTYLPLPTNAWYNTWIAPFASRISPAMQNCASPDLYFEVSPTEGISDAMTALFRKVVAQARLTN